MRDGGRPERIESIAKAVDWPSRRNGRVDGSTALRFPLPTTDPGRGIRVGQHENSSFCWLGSSRVATMWPPTGIPLGQRKKNLSAVLFDRFSGFVVQRERERERAQWRPLDVVCDCFFMLSFLFRWKVRPDGQHQRLSFPFGGPTRR